MSGSNPPVLPRVMRHQNGFFAKVKTENNAGAKEMLVDSQKKIAVVAAGGAANEDFVIQGERGAGAAGENSEDNQRRGSKCEDQPQDLENGAKDLTTEGSQTVNDDTAEEAPLVGRQDGLQTTELRQMHEAKIDTLNILKRSSRLQNVAKKRANKAEKNQETVEEEKLFREFEICVHEIQQVEAAEAAAAAAGAAAAALAGGAENAFPPSQPAATGGPVYAEGVQGSHSRTLIEPYKAMRLKYTRGCDGTQCGFLWGKENADSVCYLCGFPFSTEDILGRNKIFGQEEGSTYPGGVFYNNPEIVLWHRRWGRPSAEHVEFAELCYGAIGLPGDSFHRPKINDNQKRFQQKGLRWAHFWCNEMKNDTPFITFNDRGAEVNTRNIRLLITSLWRGNTGARFYDAENCWVIDRTDAARPLKYQNLVHCFVSRLGGVRPQDRWIEQRVEIVTALVQEICNDINSCVKNSQELYDMIALRLANPYGPKLPPWPPAKIKISETAYGQNSPSLKAPARVEGGGGPGGGGAGGGADEMRSKRQRKTRAKKYKSRKTRKLRK